MYLKGPIGVWGNRQSGFVFPAGWFIRTAFAGWLISSRGWIASFTFRRRWWIRPSTQIPPAWLEGDEDELERLLERLMRRRARVPDLIEQCCSGPSNPFPDWRP